MQKICFYIPEEDLFFKSLEDIFIGHFEGRVSHP